jgi:TolB protein
MGGNAETEPEWSPDSARIVFRVVPKTSPNGDIYVMNADGGGKKQLVGGAGDNIRPHWSPDGRYVAFTSNRTGKWEVFMVEVESGTIFQVTQTEKTTLCTSWSP